MNDIGREKLIVSLVPGATEMVAAVGALAQLVGVSHECDWPGEVTALPRVTATPIDPSRPSAEIDHAVREMMASGRAVIGIDVEALEQLRPDLVITQQLCDVCAVADGEAIALSHALASPPEVLTLAGTTLSGVWDDIRAVGRASGHAEEGERVAARLAADVTAMRSMPLASRPRVVVIEWLDPPFLAGHWVPEMVDAAGGVDVGAVAGSHSRTRRWGDITALDPDIILISLCGFGVDRARQEFDRVSDPGARRWFAARSVAFLDGNAYTSRAGPRLVEGIAMMRRAIVGSGGRRGPYDAAATAATSASTSSASVAQFVIQRTSSRRSSQT